MTVSYSDNFGKLLLRWRGSLWKSIWKDVLGFLVLYYIINFSYRFALNDDQQHHFQKFIQFCNSATSYIPLLFLLGFYVFMIVGRWWDQFGYISWPDRFLMLLGTYVPGDTVELRLIRRTIARWCNLVSVLAWRNISVRILKRFPTMSHVVKSGLFTEEEYRLYDTTEAPYGKYFLPIIWMSSLLKQSQEKGIIGMVELKNLLKELQTFRSGFVMLFCYDWISVPLVYTQVVTIATYGYFVICLIGRQEPNGVDMDMYFPIFTILQFLFYMGWLKVGEDLMNPFGEDDDDFDMNYILDRNFQISFMIADSVNGQLPELTPDAFWDDPEPKLAHTRASLLTQDKTFEGHLKKFKLNDDEMIVVLPNSEEAKEFLADAESPNPINNLRNVVSHMKLIGLKRQGTSKDDDVESPTGSNTTPTSSKNKWKKMQKSLALDSQELEDLNTPEKEESKEEAKKDENSNTADATTTTQVDQLLDETIDSITQG